MRLRFAGDNRILRGATALDCLRDHMHGDVDGVMGHLATAFQLNMSYATLTTLEERAVAFVKTAIADHLLVDVSAQSKRAA
jgi:hypothetical protein